MVEKIISCLRSFALKILRHLWILKLISLILKEILKKNLYSFNRLNIVSRIIEIKLINFYFSLIKRSKKALLKYQI